MAEALSPSACTVVKRGEGVLQAWRVPAGEGREVQSCGMIVVAGRPLSAAIGAHLHVADMNL